MPTLFCCITNCETNENSLNGINLSNNSTNNGCKKRKIFYRFPQNPERKHLWLTKIGVSTNTERVKYGCISSNSRICNAHFATGKPNLDTNHIDYIPTIFPWSSKEDKQKSLLAVEEYELKIKEIEKKILAKAFLNVNSSNNNHSNLEANYNQGHHRNLSNSNLANDSTPDNKSITYCNTNKPNKEKLNNINNINNKNYQSTTTTTAVTSTNNITAAAINSSYNTNNNSSTTPTTNVAAQPVKNIEINNCHHDHNNSINLNSQNVLKYILNSLINNNNNNNNSNSNSGTVDLTQTTTIIDSINSQIETDSNAEVNNTVKVESVINSVTPLNLSQNPQDNNNELSYGGVEDNQIVNYTTSGQRKIQQIVNGNSTINSMPPLSTTPLSTSTTNSRSCTCTKSGCLKLYCECFSSGNECCPSCSCINCRNNQMYSEQRMKIVNSYLERDPTVFSSKIEFKDVGKKHTKGCNCLKSSCLKNYCECFENKVFCSSLCRCRMCFNTQQHTNHHHHNHQQIAASCNPPNTPSVNATTLAISNHPHNINSTESADSCYYKYASSIESHSAKSCYDARDGSPLAFETQSSSGNTRRLTHHFLPEDLSRPRSASNHLVSNGSSNRPNIKRRHRFKSNENSGKYEDVSSNESELDHETSSSSKRHCSHIDVETVSPMSSCDYNYSNTTSNNNNQTTSTSLAIKSSIEIPTDVSFQDTNSLVKSSVSANEIHIKMEDSFTATTTTDASHPLQEKDYTEEELAIMQRLRKRNNASTTSTVTPPSATTNCEIAINNPATVIADTQHQPVTTSQSVQLPQPTIDLLQLLIAHQLLNNTSLQSQPQLSTASSNSTTPSQQFTTAANLQQQAFAQYMLPKIVATAAAATVPATVPAIVGPSIPMSTLAGVHTLGHFSSQSRSTVATTSTTSNPLSAVNMPPNQNNKPIKAMSAEDYVRKHIEAAERAVRADNLRKECMGYKKPINKHHSNNHHNHGTAVISQLPLQQQNSSIATIDNKNVILTESGPIKIESQLPTNQQQVASNNNSLYSIGQKSNSNNSSISGSNSSHHSNSQHTDKQKSLISGAPNLSIKPVQIKQRSSKLLHPHLHQNYQIKSLRSEINQLKLQINLNRSRLRLLESHVNRLTHQHSHTNNRKCKSSASESSTTTSHQLT